MSSPRPRSSDRDELNASFRGAPPATSDDVSITWDGRRLDTIEKVRAFIAEIEAQLADETHLSDAERARLASEREVQRLAHGYDRR